MRSRGKSPLQRDEEDRRLDVAGVIDGVDRGAVRWMCSGCRIVQLDPAEPQPEPHAAQADPVQAGRRPVSSAISRNGGPITSDVERHGDVGGKRADGGDERGHEKRPERLSRSGLRPRILESDSDRYSTATMPCAVRFTVTRVVGAALAALARAIERVLVEKQRSSAQSTFCSIDFGLLAGDLGDFRDDEELRAIEHALLAEREVLGLGQERQALEHFDDVVDGAGAHPIRVVLEPPFPVLVIVDLAVAEQPEQPLDLFVADRAAEADAVNVVHGNEHGGFVGDHAQVIKTAGCTENCFGFDALNDAESVIWVNDLVTNLECHTSPTA